MGSVALTNGELTARGETSPFGLALAPKSDGNWVLKDARFPANMMDLLDNKDALQSLVDTVGRLLKTINMWPGESSDKGGARLMLNQTLAPPEATGKVIISFRPEMLSLPASNWANLWQMIEGRGQR